MKSFKKIIYTILPSALGVFLVYKNFDLLSKEQVETVKSHFKNAHYHHILFSLLFMKLSQASRAVRWNYNLKHLGYQSNFLINFISISIGYMVNLTIPRSGEVSRALLLKKYQNIPFDKAFGTIVAERIIDLMILFLLCFVGLIANYQLLYNFVLRHIDFKLLIFILLIGVMTIAISIILILKNKTLKTKLFYKFKGFSEGIQSIWKMKNKTAYIVHSLFIWVAFILSFYFGTLAIDNTANLPLNAVLISFITGSIAIGFTNGGIGAFPLLIAQILNSYHIPIEDGTAFGWLLWSTQTALVITLGLLSFLFLALFPKKVKNNSK